jgi:hypothetical protein
VVSFDDTAQSAIGQGNSAISCKENELALAIPRNKDFMKKYINGLRSDPGKASNYTAALIHAFAFFANSTATGMCNKVVDASRKCSGLDIMN